MVQIQRCAGCLQSQALAGLYLKGSSTTLRPRRARPSCTAVAGEMLTDSFPLSSARNLAVGSLYTYTRLCLLCMCVDLYIAHMHADQGVQLCSLKPDSGPCEAYVPSYFYNSTSGKCESFVYGGCNGNANRFSSRDQCRKECGQLLTMHVNNRTLIALIILPRTVCSLPADAGNCLAAFPAFYYDAQVNKCKSFVYGGCGGNGNRFQSVDMCRRACGKIGVPSLFTN